MKKRTLFASTVTLSTMSAGYALIRQFSQSILYREHLEVKDNEWYEDMGGKKIKIKNHKKMILQGYFFFQENAQRTVIGLHALKKSASSLKESVVYLKQLFPDAHILLYDAHAHGLSDGYIRGFGYKDILDLMYFNTYILQKFGDDHRIIMYGQGMGANTILNAAGLGKLKNVDCIISEGAYTDVYHYLGALCQKETKIISSVCSPIIQRILKDEVGVNMKKMNTVHLVKDNQIPTVYIHSKNDSDVPFRMVFPLYNATNSYKFLFPIKKDYLYQLNGEEDDYLSSLQEFLNDTIRK